MTKAQKRQHKLGNALRELKPGLTKIPNTGKAVHERIARWQGRVDAKSGVA